MQSDTILLYLRTRSDFSNNVKNVNYFIEQARSSLVALYDNGNDTNYDLIGRSSSIEYPAANMLDDNTRVWFQVDGILYYFYIMKYPKNDYYPWISDLDPNKYLITSFTNYSNNNIDVPYALVDRK